MSTIGVLRSSTSASRGSRVSAMAVSTAAVRTTQSIFAQLELFNFYQINKLCAILDGGNAPHISPLDIVPFGP